MFDAHDGADLAGWSCRRRVAKRPGIDIASTGWAWLDPTLPGGKPIRRRTEPRFGPAPDPTEAVIEQLEKQQEKLKAKAAAQPMPEPEFEKPLHPLSAQPRRIRAWGRWCEAAE
jgi:hypothetical protein